MDGVLNIFLAKKDSGCVIFGNVSSEERTFVKNINGSTLGKTFNAHAEMPSSDVEIYFAGFFIIQTRKKKMQNVARVFVRFCPEKVVDLFFIFPRFYLTL